MYQYRPTKSCISTLAPQLTTAPWSFDNEHEIHTWMVVCGVVCLYCVFLSRRVFITQYSDFSDKSQDFLFLSVCRWLHQCKLSNSQCFFKKFFVHSFKLYQQGNNGGVMMEDSREENSGEAGEKEISQWIRSNCFEMGSLFLWLFLFFHR